MTEFFNKARVAAVYWRMAILWFGLFSLNSLGTAILASLAGADWATLNTQARFTICVSVFVNWTGTIMAFLSKASHRLEDEKQSQ